MDTLMIEDIVLPFLRSFSIVALEVCTIEKGRINTWRSSKSFEASYSQLERQYLCQCLSQAYHSFKQHGITEEATHR